MGTTSAALDTSAPPEIQEALRRYISAEKAKGNPQFANRTHLDQDGCCLIEDLGGHACPGKTCAYAHPDPTGAQSKVGPDYVSHKRLEDPTPGVAAAVVKGSVKARKAAARKRKPAGRKRPARRRPARRKTGRRRR